MHSSYTLQKIVPKLSIALKIGLVDLQILLEIRWDVVKLCPIIHSYISVEIGEVVDVEISNVSYQISPLENYALR